VRGGGKERLPTGGLRLRAALRRLRQAGGPLPAEAPQPATAWEALAEARLAALERQLSNQNRLLLLTLVGIFADLLYGFTR
jgi:hypothetical protein